MKLISLHIENFGGLSQYDLNFEAGITTVMEPNGFGKTTLAEFIRAMLYGFPRKTKTLDKSLRQKYTPWNGGQFGGNLVFEHQNQRYRVERTFSATPKGDTFTLIDLSTNRKTTRFSEELGQEIFGLDAESFERSTYLPQMQEAGPLATASIQAKLTELVEDSSEMVNFDKAMAALKAKRSALIPYRGSGGSVAEAASKITALQLKLDTAREQRQQYLVLQQEAAQTEAKLESTQEELSLLHRKIADAAQNAEAAVRQEQYAKLNSSYHQTLIQAATLQTMYPAGFPDSQSLRSAETAAERLEVLKNQTVTTAADLHAQQILEEKAVFFKQLPTDGQIMQCRSDCEKYDALQSAIHAAEHEAAQRPKRFAAPVIAVLLGTAAAVAGIWLICLREFLLGGMAVGIGSAAILAAFLISLLRKKQRKSRAEESMDKLYRECDQCSAQIMAFLRPYFGAVEPKQFLSMVTRLQLDVEVYRQAQQQMHDWHSRKAKHEDELEQCRQALITFFDRYKIEMDEDVRPQLYRLRDDLHDARNLLAQKQELALRLEDFHRQYEKYLTMELTPESDLRQWKEKELELREVHTALSKKLLYSKQELQTLRAQAVLIPQLKEELEHWQAKLTQDRENVRILDATMELLQLSKENLSTAYLGTIEARFGDYLSQLEEVSGEICLIDTDLQIRLERFGNARELAYFSAGQTDLVMLCMRLALVDALFREQEVFIVLDDPFVNLDDAHTMQAQKLLQKLATRRQILYLTCHSSRTI